MNELPEPEIYERELSFMPYRDSLKKVIDIITSQAPLNGSLLDLMCGPGYLLGVISQVRPDLNLRGVDIDERYFDYSRVKYPRVDFEVGDVLSWKSGRQYDFVTCTGALHHVHYDEQAVAVERIKSRVKPEGLVIISDCYVDDYSNEMQRKVAAAKLGYEYLRETIMNGAPNQIVGVTADILHNDVMGVEFKTSLQRRLPVLESFFSHVKTIKTWPSFSSGYGDYISVCSQHRRMN